MNIINNPNDVFLNFDIILSFNLWCKDIKIFFMLMIFFVKINIKNKKCSNFNRICRFVAGVNCLF